MTGPILIISIIAVALMVTAFIALSVIELNRRTGHGEWLRMLTRPVFLALIFVVIFGGSIYSIAYHKVHHASH